MLDSGSNGDIFFKHKRNKEYIPAKEQFAPQWWRTSNGTFKTTKVGNLEVCFPEYSNNKQILIQPDIVDMPEDSDLPTYDLILGVKTMSKLGIVLDFGEKMITIDQIKLPMKSIESFKDVKNLNDFQRKHLQPTSTLDATKHVVEILDAKYKKANLVKIISNSYGHLSSQQQHKLLTLVVEYKELFDDTLGDSKTEPVSLKLKKDAKLYHG